MATVNKLELEQAALEHELKNTITADADIVSAVRAGYAAAGIAATHAILDLAVKGVIPEGKGGRISEAIHAAIEASKERVTA